MVKKQQRKKKRETCTHMQGYTQKMLPSFYLGINNSMKFIMDKEQSPKYDLTHSKKLYMKVALFIVWSTSSALSNVLFPSLQEYAQASSSSRLFLSFWQRSMASQDPFLTNKSSLTLFHRKCKNDTTYPSTRILSSLFFSYIEAPIIQRVSDTYSNTFLTQFKKNKSVQPQIA